MGAVLIMIILNSVPSVQAAQESLGTFTLGQNATLIQLCSSCTYNNITSVTDPSGAFLVINQIMTKSGTAFYYNLSGGNLTKLGRYNVNGVGNEGIWAYYFYVTGNGYESPGSSVILGFSLILLLIFVGSVVVFIKGIGHIINADFNIMDLALSWGLYFALLALLVLENYYLGNPDVHSWLTLFVQIFAIPMVILPLIALLISFFIQRRRDRVAKEWNPMKAFEKR